MNVSLIGMLVTELLRLALDARQRDALLLTVRACNAAANRAAEVAHAHRTADKIAVQRLVYPELRARFGLPAQMAVLAVHKACAAYKRDKEVKPVFRELGVVVYDQRILSWKGRDRASILTLGGRLLVPLLYLGRWTAARPERVRGQADLIYRRGEFYLAAVVDVPEPPPGGEPDGWPGVDLLGLPLTAGKPRSPAGRRPDPPGVPGRAGRRSR